MAIDLNDYYELISSETEINNFIYENKETLTILDEIHPYLVKFFPNSHYSLEVCDNLAWTTESKLLLNVYVGEEMFFNGILTHFNEIYNHINPLIEEILCPVVLFPIIEGKQFSKFEDNCVINLVAKNAYFSNDFDKNQQREMTIRNISKSQQTEEIIHYCKSHENPDFSDIVYDLQLDIFDVDEIIEELLESGMELNISY